MRSVVLALSFVLVACGGEPDGAPPAPTQDTLQRVMEPGRAKACTDGDSRACRVVYPPSEDGVVDCFESTQLCVDGHWTACGEKAKPEKDAGK